MTDIVERLKAAAKPLQHLGNEEEELAVAAMEAADEIEKLRGLLVECIPKLMGDDYDYSDTRICRECGYYSGHDEDCLVRRVMEALR